MRRGEICALRWQDIDFDRRTINVVHNMGKQVGGSFGLTTPKDPAGGDASRTIPMSERLLRVLAEKKAAIKQVRKDLGLPWKETLYVLGKELSEKPYSPDGISKAWAAYADSTDVIGLQGEPLTFHDLRHTFATLATKDKIMDVKTLSAILGHRDSTITLNVYADGLEEAKRAGMDNLDASLEL